MSRDWVRRREEDFRMGEGTGPGSRDPVLLVLGSSETGPGLEGDSNGSGDLMYMSDWCLVMMKGLKEASI